MYEGGHTLPQKMLKHSVTIFTLHEQYIHMNIHTIRIHYMLPPTPGEEVVNGRCRKLTNDDSCLELHSQ